MMALKFKTGVEDLVKVKLGFSPKLFNHHHTRSTHASFHSPQPPNLAGSNKEGTFLHNLHSSWLLECGNGKE